MTPHAPASLRLLIVDDHAVVREGLEAMLRRDALFESIATASSGREALTLCGSYQPQVLLLDVRMPGQDGFTVLEALRQQFPEIRVLILSASASSADVNLARRLGASGYLPKTTDRQSLIDAIRKVATGGTNFAAETPATRDELSALSARELEVLRHLGRGMSNADLGRILGVSEHTIKSHLKAVFGKLGVADRAEAVARAYELGLVPVER
ncbi:MAG: response regulator [Verrucomicrobium sp.]|nr:response regulator transcription factor [Verrucomicrobium sp.]